MITVGNIEKLAAEVVPFELACDWDNVGLLVGDPCSEVDRIMLAVDISSSVIDEAIEKKCRLIVSHHPIIFNVLKRVRTDDYSSAKIYKLIKNGISAICLHTNLDFQYGGMNDALCEVCGMRVTEVVQDDGKPQGRIAVTDREMTVEEFAKKVKSAIDASGVTYFDSGRSVSKVGIVTGSGASGIDASLSFGCDTFLTGELRHDIFIDAKEMGINLVCAGHYYTEKWGLSLIKNAIAEKYPEIEFFEAQSLETLYKTV